MPVSKKHQKELISWPAPSENGEDLSEISWLNEYAGKTSNMWTTISITFFLKVVANKDT